MGTLTLVTLNLLSGAANWAERLPLIADGLRALQPDVICLQEVVPIKDETAGEAGLSSRAENAAEQLGDLLSYAHIAWRSQTASPLGDEAVAILSRLPFIDQGWIDLNGQGRIAQQVTVQLDGQPLVVANTHLYWQPGDSEVRLEQVERMIAWLRSIPGKPPVIVCGDFNGTPETQAIRRMREEFASAYQAIHGREPERTFPTPLPRSPRDQLGSLRRLLPYIRWREFPFKIAGVLDYIFIDRRMAIADCRLVLDHPAPHDLRLYPSDHYALWAKVEMMKGAIPE